VTTDAAGAWTTKDATAWTSGFLPGSFWQLHELTGEPAWAEKARAWQAGVASQRTRTDTHDLGFMLMSSVGNDARVTDDPTARQAVLEGAASLAARHDPAVGVLKAHWDWAPGDVKIIVDQTMNLELLLWAASHGGDAGLRDIAVSHGLKARESLVRPDGSTFHVAAFDSSGALQSQYTHQGAGDDTAWARGQSTASRSCTGRPRTSASCRPREP
jgi:unsaturated chondroitin disaccharide hydrolase